MVLLVDAKVGATPLDVEAWRYLTSLGAPITVVATKVDRLPSSRKAAALSGIRRTLGLPEETPIIPASAHSGEGMKQLWSEITLHLESSTR